jgi:glutamyl-tRNA synthetase
VDMAGFFFREEIEPGPEALVGKKMSPGESAQALRRAHEVIAALPSMEIEPLESALRDLAEEMGLKAGQLFGILRMAVTGQRVSPPLIESMEIVGRGKVLERIAHAAEVMEGWEGSGTA